MSEQDGVNALAAGLDALIANLQGGIDGKDFDLLAASLAEAHSLKKKLAGVPHEPPAAPQAETEKKPETE